MWAKILQYGLGIMDKMLRNTADAELRVDGARKGELERRDKQNEVRDDAKKHREIDNSSTDSDVIDRL